jgi:hypothetical protein
MSKKVKMTRNLQICKSPSNEETLIAELHGTKDDKISEGWLAGLPEGLSELWKVS